MLTDSIPAVEERPSDVVPSEVRALIGGPSASRRSLLKGVVVSAVAATLVPFEWLMTRSRASAGAASEWTSPSCRDAYPYGYDASTANWHTGPAVCYGGWRIGSYPCNSDKWHFEGERTDDDAEEWYTAHRVDAYCGYGETRSAWRWTAGDGLYRCSDAVTTVHWSDGSSYTGLTIAMCKL